MSIFDENCDGDGVDVKASVIFFRGRGNLGGVGRRDVIVRLGCNSVGKRYL